MADLVGLEVDGGVATLTLQRPPVNALDDGLVEQLLEVATEVSRRADVRAAVLHGGRRVFAAGADIRQMASASVAEAGLRVRRLGQALDTVAALPVPVVAAVNGYALGGGCELALCADLRVVADDARLGQPEILLGIIPGAGGTQRLPRLVGPSRAKDLVFTGRHVDAQEASGMGLADRVVPADDVLPTALELARTLAAGPTAALRAAKTAVDVGAGTDLASGLALERELFAALFATQDQATGMASFLEHGPGRATFEGR